MPNDLVQGLRRLACAALACFTPVTPAASAQALQASAAKPAQDLSNLTAWDSIPLMGIGLNIGNTLENTAAWETGWGNPPITKALIDSLAADGFKTVRVPVAWDSYSKDGKIDPDKLKRVAKVVDWITSDAMFCVINIHWDGGWIDSDDKTRFAKTYHSFSGEAEKKFKSYWTKIATYFRDRDQHLIFEGLNEESNFGSEKDPYATLGRVNQLFVDTVRASGGNNSKRLLVIAGYSTDIDKTATQKFIIPSDTVPNKLLLSIHYYTPWPFAGMTKDESFGKMRMTWGTKADVAELRSKFDKLEAYSKSNDIPVFVGEFGADSSKDPRSRSKWMLSVALSAQSRNMVPVLWDIGRDVSRSPPYSLSPELAFVLQQLKTFNDKNPPAATH